jgi:hypothetical protein
MLIRVNENRLLECGLANLIVADPRQQFVAADGFDDLEAEVFHGRPVSPKPLAVFFCRRDCLGMSRYAWPASTAAPGLCFGRQASAQPSANRQESYRENHFQQSVFTQPRVKAGGCTFGCCARAARGQTATMPRAATNSRRPMVTGIMPLSVRGLPSEWNNTTRRACCRHVRKGGDVDAAPQLQ